LGCELLKDLAMMGFKNIDVIDMDTIELSNLNRQFLFRRKDIGQSKAKVAAEFINKRLPGCNVVPHFCKIQDYDESFYRQFHIIVCGLDSIVARRWINGMLISMVRYEEDEDRTVDQSSVIPMIDGGTEGFKGNARVILPTLTPCIDCNLSLFPPQISYPLCTIASTPRLPEHCIEYVKIIQWEKENPFKCALDGDDPEHVSWVYEKAQERANKFNITGFSYRLVQGVLKNIIPAVSSTNAGKLFLNLFNI
jgi:NEDD8-activating enzyme E1